MTCPHHSRFQRDRVGHDGGSSCRPAFRRRPSGRQQPTKGKKMGLDMYAFATAEQLAGSVDFTAEAASEIYYWRKHPNLHGWMERLYRNKGGKEDSFNCVNIQLTADDLQRLEADTSVKPAANRRLLLRGLGRHRAGERSRLRREGASSFSR
jgi:hypothetical protein